MNLPRLTKAEVELLFDQLYECGDELEELNRLKKQALAHPCKRRSKRWNVRSADGSIRHVSRINENLSRRPPAPKRNNCHP